MYLVINLLVEGTRYLVGLVLALCTKQILMLESCIGNGPQWKSTRSTVRKQMYWICWNWIQHEVAKCVFSCECLISLNVLVLLRNEDLVAFGMPCFGVGFSRMLFRI